MNTTVLLVDDEEAVLKGYIRSLGGMFTTEIAHNAQEALAKIEAEDKYALVMSDHRMPGMTGIELLQKVAEIRPNTVRMLITGYADLQMSLDAINEGSVFRMLTKPCTPPDFYKAIEDGLRQHELVTSEKELFEQTLNGSIQMLTDILSMLDPGAFGRANQRATAAKLVAKKIGVEDIWEVEIAASLAEMGRITLPAEVAQKRVGSTDLNEKEFAMLSRLPEFSSKLLARIPRLEGVAQSVLYQNKNFDGTGFPDDKLHGEFIPLTSRILRIIEDVYEDLDRGMKIGDILEILKSKPNKYDPQIVGACEEISTRLENILTRHKKKTDSNSSTKKRLVKLEELKVGDLLLSNIETVDGILIINAGNIVRTATLQRIQNFSSIMRIREPIEVTSYDM